MVTERLYYHDSYLRDFQARVIESADDGRRVYLDRTAFYPASGGQPFDLGALGGARVVEVVDEGGRIAHVLDRAIDCGDVRGEIDWPRRYDHMQQHSGQHLLSAVFIETYGMETVSFHLGDAVSTIDLEVPAVDPAQLRAVELRANEIVCENRPIAVSYHESQEDLGLRKESDREGVLRVVSIDRLDRSACGGTHLRATGEIGPILLRRLERVRNTMRVEFLCGLRAVRRARADFDSLSRVAQLFSASLDETPAMVAAQMDGARETEKQRRKLAADLAVYQGRELYDATTPGPRGVRRVVRRQPAGTFDDLRPVAQSFTAQPQALFIGVIEDPPSVLVAASADAGIDAGKLLKAALAESGGRGGGSPRMAQGSVPEKGRLDRVLEAIDRQAAPHPTA
jgi:alanyl-tRNA synthetase